MFAIQVLLDRCFAARSWATLGRSWAPLGRSWGALGSLLAALGVLLAALGPVLGRFWPLLGPTWPLLGRPWPPKMAQVEPQDGPRPPKFVKMPFFKKYWKTYGKTMILPPRRVPKRAKMAPRWPLGRSCSLLGRSWPLLSGSRAVLGLSCVGFGWS